MVSLIFFSFFYIDMLTANELLNIPADIKRRDFKEYFDAVLLPRLVHETFGIDGCMVDDAGTRRHILDVLIDGLAQAAMKRNYCQVPWRDMLVFYVLLEKQTFHDIRTYNAFRPHITADAYMAVLDTWLEVYVANKDPLQHFPKLNTKVIEGILRFIVDAIPMKPFDPVHMRLADRLDELGLEWLRREFTRNWSYMPLPNPECLLFLARGDNTDGILGYLSTCPPCGVLAEYLLRCLILVGRSERPIESMERMLQPMHSVSQIMDRLNTGVYLEDLARQTLAVWLKAFEENPKARILLDLVTMYRRQALGTRWQRRAAVFLGIKCGIGGMICAWFKPDPALMERAKGS